MRLPHAKQTCCVVARAHLRPWAVGVLGCALSWPAQAFTVVLGVWGGTGQEIFLQVGVGSFSGLYETGGTPLKNTTINQVSVSVPVAAVGNSVAQAMASNTGATSSFYDGAAMCSAGQLYIGAYYRRTNNANTSAALMATPSGPLTNASGDTIAMNQISWTISGLRGGGANFINNGTFTGAAQAIASIPRNRWTETCLNFSYANTTSPPPGTYSSTVTYTLSAAP